MFRDSWPKSHPLEPRTPRLPYYVSTPPPPPRAIDCTWMCGVCKGVSYTNSSPVDIDDLREKE